MFCTCLHKQAVDEISVGEMSFGKSLLVICPLESIIMSFGKVSVDDKYVLWKVSVGMSLE